MSEFHVKTTTKNRESVTDNIHPLGVVKERWSDGSFNFETYDEQCADELVEMCEAMEVECELV